MRMDIASSARGWITCAYASMARVMAAAFAGILALAISAPVGAQPCQPGLVTDTAFVTNGTVHAFTWWDPDGAGPASSRLAVGGNFSDGGRINIGAYDPVMHVWTTLGTGLTGLGTVGVHAMVGLANGDLVAGGIFSVAGTTPVHGVARWDGTAWASMGGGLGSASGVGGSFVFALLKLPNGDIIAGGTFQQAGALSGSPVAAENVARWDGTQWRPMGLGVNSTVNALALMPNGDIVAAGVFNFAGGHPARCVASWNGTDWSALSTGLTIASPGVATGYSLAVLPSGDLVVGGAFTSAGGIAAMNVATWNGTAWSSFGDLGSSVRSMVVLPNGKLCIGTEGGQISQVFRWTGADWYLMMTGYASPSTAMNALLVLPDRSLAVGGNFVSLVGVSGYASAARYRLAGLCPADFNCDSVVTMQDVFDFLGAWFAGSPTANFNGTGGLTTQDIFDFVAAWFASC